MNRRDALKTAASGVEAFCGMEMADATPLRPVQLHARPLTVACYMSHGTSLGTMPSVSDVLNNEESTPDANGTEVDSSTAHGQAGGTQAEQPPAWVQVEDMAEAPQGTHCHAGTEGWADVRDMPPPASIAEQGHSHRPQGSTEHDGTSGQHGVPAMVR